MRKLTVQLTAALALLGMVRASMGAPADVFDSPAPPMGSDPPKGADLRDGDSSVSTQTGALQYSYPIAVPPGRLGNQPNLSLTYSSQAAIYGGIAAGWSLSIPTIELDTSEGTLRPADLDASGSFISTMAGSRPLIEVNEPHASDVWKTFRAQNDTSYTRYERMNAAGYAWRALSPDGTISYFGDQYLLGAPAQFDRVPLTRTVDPFGNTVEYRWILDSEGAYYIDNILYTSNPGANLPASSRVAFKWESAPLCNGMPVGAAESYRAGRRVVDGNKRLSGITVTAFDPATTAVRHTRQITLQYDPETEKPCGNKGFAPYRALEAIQESAWHDPTKKVVLPPVVFTYGKAARKDWEWVDHGTWPLDSGSHLSTALNYGRRFIATSPTIRGLFLDIDGDGRNDHVRLADGGVACTAQWYRNTGTGFAFGGFIPLPTLPWGVGDEAGTACSLDGQTTTFDNVPTGGGPCGIAGNPNPSTISYRWMDVTSDGRVDLVAAIHHDPELFDPNVLYDGNQCPPTQPGPCTVPYDLFPYDDEGIWEWPDDAAGCPQVAGCTRVDGDCIEAAIALCPGEHYDCGFDEMILHSCLEAGEVGVCYKGSLCTGQDPDPACPTAPPVGPPSCDWPRVPQQRCEAYPWLIYENLGEGNFATRPIVKYNPVPLESHENDSPAGKGSYGSGWHLISDLDGDGINDAAILPGSPLAPKEDWSDAQVFWYVFKGDGKGGFYGNGEHPFVWFVPRYAAPSGSESLRDNNLPPRSTTFSTAGLNDFNGDGLPDYYWRKPFANTVEVYWNNGHGFHGIPTKLAGGSIDEVGRTHLIPSANGWDAEARFMLDGTAEPKTRFLDYDDDGRVDLLYSTQDSAGQWTAPAVMFNAGRDLLAGHVLNDYEKTAVRLMGFAEDQGGPLYWDTRTDFIDIDGDGLAERIQVDGNKLVKMRNLADGKPPRLLTRIDNGTGLHVDVTYAPLSDKNVVDAGTQIPTTHWVVSELKTTDDFESSASSTRYRYADPVWSPDDRGKYGFRGFEKVRTLNAKNAVVEEQFGYDVDWSGRLVTTSTKLPAPAPGQPEQPTSIVETAWQEYTLFGGELETFHPRITRTYTCSKGQTETTCRNAPAAYKREETVWTAVTPLSGTIPLLYTSTRSYLQDGDWFDQGDRYTDTTPVLVSDATNYRLRTTDTISKVLADAVESPYARSETIWDATYRFALEERTYFDATTYATTKRTYDTLTGNVGTVTKPEQFLEAGQPRTSFVYDPLQLFVVETKNEVGQIVNTVTDYGTGAVLRSIGPNAHSCNPSCGSNLGREESRSDIDGLGRTIASYVTRDASPGYALVKVSQSSYVDKPPSLSTPTSSTTSRLIAYDMGQWTQSTAFFDGHGRAIRIETLANEGTARTYYDYDADGRLVTVTLPDPSSTSQAVVTYSYAYDPLGRPTDLVRPDGTGVHTDYDGVTETRSEVTGTLGGPDAVTQTIHDAYGRLRRVREKVADGTPPSFVDTTYGYDARDTVTNIIDPDNVTTDLIHDWDGRRIRIERRGPQTPSMRVWQYTYDRNGNLETETSPVPTGALVSDYTTTYAYDDLDRVTSRLIAIRDVPKADRELFASEQVTYSYDTTSDGNNRVGRVFEVKSFGPGATVPSLTKAFTYDAEGNVTEERLKYAIAGVAGQRRIKSTYATGGKVRTVDYGDGTVTDAAATTSTFFYDLRENPSRLEFRQPGGPLYTAAQFTRNLAGVVTQRYKPWASDPAQTATWAYDKLGRVIQQNIMASSVVANQTLTYWGSDDPKTLQHYGWGLPTRNYSFDYDDRHQLTSATVSGGSFTGSYGFTAGGRLASASVNAQAASGSDVRNRNVTYVYQSSDPEMLTSLRRTDGTTFASYSYDASGNLISRTQQGVATSFLWDGDDQLRRATTGSQREEYYYDAGGTRLGIVKRAQSGSVWKVSEVRVFLGPLEVWLSPTGSLTNTYAHLGTGTPVARVENRTSVEYQYHSTLQNLIAAVAAGGQVRVHFAYGPYGEVLQSIGGTESTHRRRFNDKYKDELTGLSYYGARYYDPVSMTWISADPAYRFTPDAAWTQPRRGNLYTFAGNNPERFVDPDGRDFFGAVADLGRAVGRGVKRAAVAAYDGTVGYTLDSIKDPVGRLQQFSPVKVGPGGVIKFGNLANPGADILVDFAVDTTVAVVETAEEFGDAIASGDVEKAVEVATCVGASFAIAWAGGRVSTGVRNNAGKQARLRELAVDDKVSKADRAWIQQEMRLIEQGKRKNIRVPPGKEMRHQPGREAAKGYSHTESPSSLQDKDLHKTRHKHDDNGKKNPHQTQDPRKAQ